MEIIIRPKKFIGDSSWYSKMESVVLVSNEEDKEKLFLLLCEQDSYWESYKDLIKIAPKEIDSEEDIKSMCSCCGKTDIYIMEELKSKVDFIIYQYDGNFDY
jgi:hypothetical protein